MTKAKTKVAAKPKTKTKAKASAANGRGGRPTVYRVTHCEIAKKIAQLGGIDRDVAEALGVTLQTITRWKVKHPEFFASLKLGKEEVDERVKTALVHRALGYEHPEDDIKVVNGEIVITPTIKHYPPDTTACIFWLKNRKPDEFRQNPEGTAGEDLAAALTTLAKSLPV